MHLTWVWHFSEEARSLLEATAGYARHFWTPQIAGTDATSKLGVILKDGYEEGPMRVRRAAAPTVGEKTFVLGPGDTLLAPREIPHQLRNSGSTTNHYLLIFSPSGFEKFIMATAVPAPDNAVAPTKPPAVAVRNVRELAEDYGIVFG